jgi:hypothetical protein
METKKPALQGGLWQRVEITRWLLCNLGAGYWVGLVKVGLIRQDNTQSLPESSGGFLAALAVEAMGLHGNLARFVDNDGDSFHWIRPPP